MGLDGAVHVAPKTRESTAGVSKSCFVLLLDLDVFILGRLLLEIQILIVHILQSPSDFLSSLPLYMSKIKSEYGDTNGKTRTLARIVDEE